MQDKSNFNIWSAIFCWLLYPISLSLTQVSGSMQGEKITQLQDAMFTILDQMTEDDYFSILTFNYAVQVGLVFSQCM